MRSLAVPPVRARAAALLFASASTATAFLAFNVPAPAADLPVAGPVADAGDQCRVAVEAWGVTKVPNCAGD